MTDLDAGRAIDRRVDRDVGEVGERMLERLQFPEQQLALQQPVPASLSRVNVVEPACNTRRCGVLSRMGMAGLPGMKFPNRRITREPRPHDAAR